MGKFETRMFVTVILFKVWPFVLTVIPSSGRCMFNRTTVSVSVKKHFIYVAQKMRLGESCCIFYFFHHFKC